MSLEKLEERILDLERLTFSLAGEVRDNTFGQAYHYCVDMLNRIKTPAVLVTKDYKFLYLNPTALEHIQEELGITHIDNELTCYKNLYGKNKVCDKCVVKASIKNKKVHVGSYESKNTKYIVICIPLLYNGTSGAISLFIPQ